MMRWISKGTWRGGQDSEVNDAKDRDDDVDEDGVDGSRYDDENGHEDRGDGDEDDVDGSK